jgi:hypothetical protein
MLTDAQAAGVPMPLPTPTVTAKPPSMKTSSPAIGTDAPGAPPEVAAQVAVELQLPEATENRFRAKAEECASRRKSKMAGHFFIGWPPANRAFRLPKTEKSTLYGRKIKGIERVLASYRF